MNSTPTAIWTLSATGATYTAPVGYERTHNVMHIPDSYAFCCPHCGEVWARRTIIGPDGAVQPWFFWTVPCERCDAGGHFSGSLYLFSDPTYLSSLPTELLMREFLLLSKGLENE